MTDKLLFEVVDRVAEITKGADMEIIPIVIEALKTGLQVVVIRRNGRLKCYIENQPIT